MLFRSYIQSYILNANGLPTPISFSYDAKISKHNKNMIIPCSISNFDTYENLKKTNTLEYAKKICNILGYYLHTVHNIDLLSAKISFLKDWQGNLWLSYAKEIFIRNSSDQEKLQYNRLDLFRSKFKSIKAESMISTFRQKNSNRLKILSEAMTNNYNMIKRKMQINNDLWKTKKFELNKTFEKLRVNSPYKLCEMLDLKFNPKEIINNRIKEGKEISLDEQKLAEIMDPLDIMTLYLYEPISNSNRIKINTRKCISFSLTRRYRKRNIRTALISNENRSLGRKYVIENRRYTNIEHKLCISDKLKNEKCSTYSTVNNSNFP